MKTVVVAFGRMNPPTVGHKKLVDKLKSIALQKHGSPFLYLSHSQDKKKNPLSYEQKLKYARKAFGSVVTKSVAKTLLQVMKELEGKGFTDAIIIAGSDRLAEFQSLLDKYNGKDFNMTSVKVVSAGERDPDAEGVEGMSASKLRGLAQQGDLKAFISGVPLSATDGKRLFNDIRSGMDIKEEQEMNEVDFVELEEATRVLTLQQRQKRRLTMKRLGPRIARLRKIKLQRVAQKPALIKRARKAAIMLLKKRVAGEQGQNYSSLSPSQKIQIDRMVEKKLPLVDKLAKRLLPKIMKKELERIKSLRSGGSNDN
jgi:nicotinic acid mononucleotide adenylyltransferase